MLAAWLTVVTKSSRLAEFYRWLRQRLVDLSGSDSLYIPWGLMDCANNEVIAFCAAFCRGRTPAQYKADVQVGSTACRGYDVRCVGPCGAGSWRGWRGTSRGSRARAPTAAQRHACVRQAGIMRLCGVASMHVQSQQTAPASCKTACT